METWVDLLWLPIIELITFGLFVHFLGGRGSQASMLILSGVIFWEVFRIIQYSITVGIMWDVWSNSFSTLFVGPLQMSELIGGQAIGGVLKSIFILCLLGSLSVLFFGFNPFMVGPMVIVYLLLLAWFSISAGIFIFSLILRFGTDIQSFSWSLVYLFQPISAIFYPLDALPESIRWVAFFSPITFVMQSYRNQLESGVIDVQNLTYAVLVNAVYFVAVVTVFTQMYKWSKKTGAFARMEM